MVENPESYATYGQIGQLPEGKSIYQSLQGLGRKKIIGLDYREVDTSTSKGDKTLASRTIADADLIASGKDGSNGEIDIVEAYVLIDFGEDSGSANGLDLTTATDNQIQIQVGGGTKEDCPFVIAGSKSGQFVSGDLECVANGGGNITLYADISDLTNSTLKENLDQSILLELKDALALGDNLRIKVTTIIIAYYNGKVNVV